MNRFLLPLGIVLLLCIAVCGQSQQSDWKMVYSDEYHFIASFPDQAKQSVGDFEMSFGKGTAKRWTLDLPDTVFEIVVASFPDLSIAMEDRALMAFYKSACADIGGASACKGYYSYDQFDVLGLAGGFRGSGRSGMFAMFLVKNRFYLARVITHESMFNAAHVDMKKFIDEFLFFHTDGTEKATRWGLPNSESQNRRRSN